MAGVNYYIVKGLSIGAEFGYGLTYNTFGKITNTSRNRVNGVDQPENSTTSNSSNMNIQNLGNSTITVSVFF